MKYTIVNAIREEDTIITVLNIDVVNNAGETTVVKTKVSHFQPQSVEEIQTNISNYIAAEIRAKNSIRTCKQIMNNLPIGVELDG